jgi:hypothetical protein
MGLVGAGASVAPQRTQRALEQALEYVLALLGQHAEQCSSEGDCSRQDQYVSHAGGIMRIHLGPADQYQRMGQVQRQRIGGEQPDGPRHAQQAGKTGEAGAGKVEHDDQAEGIVGKETVGVAECDVLAEPAGARRLGAEHGSSTPYAS